MLKAVLWDNDGVLVDTERLYYEATRAALARVGVEFTEDVFAELNLRRGRSAFDLATERGIAAEVIAELRAARDAAYERSLAQSDVAIDGVERTLQNLHGRLRMGVVTSALRAHFDLAHRRTGFLRYLEFALTREDYGRTKPHPEPYLTALAHGGLRPEECVVIEDTERGLVAATAAGLRCIVVPNALGAGADFSTAHKVVSSVVEAGEEIARLLGEAR
jgi:HAD superfamily hydrolase (TIGR01509 family)